MINPIALLELLPLLKEWLENSKAKRRLQDARGQRAVEAILRAANETKLYLAGQARSEERSREREDNLSRYWTEAAAALHGIENGLAQRCRLKGAFWAEPDSWSEAELREARILLTQVAADADALLGWGDNSGTGAV